MKKSTLDYINEICDILEDACNKLSPEKFNYIIRRLNDEIEGMIN